MYTRRFLDLFCAVFYCGFIQAQRELAAAAEIDDIFDEDVNDGDTL